MTSEASSEANLEDVDQPEDNVVVLTFVSKR